MVDSTYHRRYVRSHFVEFADEKSFRIGNELSMVGTVFSDDRRMLKTDGHIRGKRRERETGSRTTNTVGRPRASASLIWLG